MEMSKLLIMHKLDDENDRPALERWFNRYHAPEVMKQPKLTRFFSTKAYINPNRSVLPQGESFNPQR